MKAIVIDASKGKSKPWPIPNFKEGDIVDIENIPSDPHLYRVEQHLKIEDGRNAGWGKERFIPLSDKDEQDILFHRLEDQVIANLCEELGDERNFIGEDDCH